MQRIPSLLIPQQLPCKDAISSSKDSLNSYDPEFWEFQYETYRYLERVSDSSLAERYQDILCNMKALISRDRDVIPIQSFLSSWYWFRKEHQTRLEFYIRNIAPLVTVPIGISFNNLASGAPTRPKHPNAGDVLFRYDKYTYLDELVSHGMMRIGPASSFVKIENDIARQDEECSKKSFLPGAHTRITTLDGIDIPIIGDVERKTTSPNYYAFCMSCDWDQELFKYFKADACVVIKDVEGFVSRIEAAAKQQLPNWYFHHCPVHYFDPYERIPNEYIDAGMSKDFKFSYQREYRFIWMPLNGEQADGYKLLALGNINNQVEIHRDIYGSI
jgi:hypothetical protein